MKVTPCECVEPGWCQRHRCFKDELDFQLCRRRPDYFQTWEDGCGPRQVESPLATDDPSPARVSDLGSARLSDPGSARVSSSARCSDPAAPPGSARVSDPAETADRRSPQALWAAPFPARLPCRRRGPVIGAWDCPTCKGRVSLKLFRCELHGCCTTIRRLEDAACCARCDAYQAPSHENERA
jgi:hypothetical protein